MSLGFTVLTLEEREARRERERESSITDILSYNKYVDFVLFRRGMNVVFPLLFSKHVISECETFVRRKHHVSYVPCTSEVLVDKNCIQWMYTATSSTPKLSSHSC